LWAAVNKGYRDEYFKPRNERAQRAGGQKTNWMIWFRRRHTSWMNIAHFPPGLGVAIDPEE
jgi:hypothetical protein